jgi:NodT family efflux transporter outer membrane factor (OMF) lipoprotein
MHDWWRQFQDPALDSLIADALHDNPSLDTAAARLRKADAMATAAGAALQPQLSLNASTTYERLPSTYIYPPPYGGTWQWQSQALVNGSYTLDLWGKNRATMEAALGQAHAAAVDALAAELTLTTGLVHAYIQLARASDQLDLANDTLEARAKVFDLARRRVAAGLDSQVDLKQAEAAVPAAREQIAVWRENVALARDQLAALAGRGPDVGAAIARPPTMTVSAHALLPSHVPAELIGRRPDVIAQRLRVEAALRDVTAAKAAFYPNIELTAFAGLQSLGLSRFFEAGSIFTGLGPAVTLPIFDGGALRAGLAGKSADADAAIAAYRQALVTALQEIADELASSQSVATQTADEGQAVTVAQQAYDLAVLRYKDGIGTYLQVLTTETQLLAQKSLAVDLRARDLDLAVNLIRSLGGGFETLPDGTRLATLMPRAPVNTSSREATP